MELNSIINDDNISMKIQDIYKYIEKNDDKIDNILDEVFDDLRNIYPNIVRTQDSVEISGFTIENINYERDRIQTSLHYHSKQILNDMSYLLAYCFKVALIGHTTITIKKR